MGGALEDFVLLHGVGREDLSVAYNFEFFPRHGPIWNSRFWSRCSSGFRSRRSGSRRPPMGLVVQLQDGDFHVASWAARFEQFEYVSA